MLLSVVTKRILQKDIEPYLTSLFMIKKNKKIWYIQKHIYLLMSRSYIIQSSLLSFKHFHLFADRRAGDEERGIKIVILSHFLVIGLCCSASCQHSRESHFLLKKKKKEGSKC